ncbi:hypothetical protein M9H77_18282 [Catharanthus roseus]|uniref:Uncharacterized protein n=1 Tax=Catharanthus roseus TaxID=4058 RepID=A0ACC0B6Z9_CATRO|nr:hypothetical protein M9H77_18282 [Catharanthus roseus]
MPILRVLFDLPFAYSRRLDAVLQLLGNRSSGSDHSSTLPRSSLWFDSHRRFLPRRFSSTSGIRAAVWLIGAGNQSTIFYYYYCFCSVCRRAFIVSVIQLAAALKSIRNLGRVKFLRKN